MKKTTKKTTEKNEVTKEAAKPVKEAAKKSTKTAVKEPAKALRKAPDSAKTSTDRQDERKKEVAKKPAVKSKSKVVSHGVGRRKRAVARVWLRRGKGAMTVNGKDFKTYFDTDVNREEAGLTFKVMKVANYDADINVYGGGVNSQAEAVKLGVARALVDHNPDCKPDMRKWRLLSVDSRVKERKKYGQRGARRKFQFVKR